MNWTRTSVLASVAVAGAAAGGALAARRALGRRDRSTEGGDATGARPRWHVLTVNRPVERVAPDGRLPEPLAELGDAVEVRLSAAPGDRGTEIAVRLRGGEPSGLKSAAARLTGDDPRWAVRAALRNTRQLVETGEILRPSQPPTTRHTLTSRPLAFATRHAREEGLL